MIKNCIIRIWEFYRDGFRLYPFPQIPLCLFYPVGDHDRYRYPDAIFLQTEKMVLTAICFQYTINKR